MTARPPTMPPEAPLAHPRQNLARRFHDDAAPPDGRPDAEAAIWRAGTFVPAALATAALLWGFLAWFATDGTTWMEGLLAALIGVGFFWIAFTFATVLAGAGAMLRRLPPASAPVRPLDVALLVPVHEEAPWDVFGNAAAMLERLAAAPGAHRWSVTVLSDTRDGMRARRRRPRSTRCAGVSRRPRSGTAAARSTPTARSATSRNGSNAGAGRMTRC